MTVSMSEIVSEIPPGAAAGPDAGAGAKAALERFALRVNAQAQPVIKTVTLDFTGVETLSQDFLDEFIPGALKTSAHCGAQLRITGAAGPARAFLDHTIRTQELAVRNEPNPRELLTYQPHRLYA